MIDKRAKSAASPSKRRDDPRQGKPAYKGNAQKDKVRPARTESQNRQEKPYRAARPTAEGKALKSEEFRKSKPNNPRLSNPRLSKPRARKPEPETQRDDESGMRIAKVMARAGLCSRRDAEAWILEGRVTLNGKVLTSPAINIQPQDQVSVDGKALAERERTRLFLFHKPRGLVTTDKDPEGRQTIFDYLRKTWPDGPRVISIGRLDINTEGLLLLTNDGGLARVLELPSTGWMRRYRVRANGTTDQSILDRLRDGLTLEGVDYAGIDATLDRVQGDNVWLSMGLREGKNREIKRVLEHIGLYVNRLIRVSYGPFQLGDQAEGTVEEVKTRVLRDQLGPALANEADADFDSPLAEAREPEPVKTGRARTPSPRSREAGRDRQPARNRDSVRERGQKPERDDRRERAVTARSEPEAGAPSRRNGSAKRAPSAPPEPSFKPRGARRHVSALRSDADKSLNSGERKKRLVQIETTDRKGRTVAVERITKAAPKRRAEPETFEQNAPAARSSRPMGRPDREPVQGRAPVRGKAPVRAKRPESQGDKRQGAKGEERAPRAPWELKAGAPAKTHAGDKKPRREDGGRKVTARKEPAGQPATAKAPSRKLYSGGGTRAGGPAGSGRPRKPR
jgi:23S rRNA pseudouridine2605 synthase